MHRRLAFVPLLLLGGCASEVDSTYSTFEDSRRVACTCHEELSFETEAACERELLADVAATDAQRACLEDVYDRREGSREFFRCQLAVQEDLSVCVADEADPCRAGALIDCGVTAAGAAADCYGDLTPNAAREIADCFEG